MASEIRWALRDSEPTEFKYYAVFRGSADVFDLDAASMLIRRSEAHAEQRYDGDGRWVHTDMLDRLDAGEKWTYEYMAIGAAEAEYVMRRGSRPKQA